MREKFDYLTVLERDNYFKGYISEPLQNKIQSYTKTLKSRQTSSDDLFRAQGALEVLDYFFDIFRHAKEDFNRMNQVKRET